MKNDEVQFFRLRFRESSLPLYILLSQGEDGRQESDIPPAQGGSELKPMALRKQQNVPDAGTTQKRRPSPEMPYFADVISNYYVLEPYLICRHKPYPSCTYPRTLCARASIIPGELEKLAGVVVLQL